MDDLVIWGAGGHAKVVAASARASGRWRVVGFIDDTAPRRAGEAFAGATVLGDRQALPPPDQAAVHLAFGHCGARAELAATLRQAGHRLASVIDPRAAIADSARLGDGCYVGVHAVINPDAVVGAVTIVNTAAVVEHDGVVGTAVHLAPRVCLAGHVRVGDRTFIGAGATVRDGLRIGHDCLVGLGSVVVRDLPDGVRAFGCPARIQEPS